MSETKTLHLRAWYVGARINLRALERGEAIEPTVQTIRAGEHGHAILFRYGAVVLIDLKPLEEAAFLETLKPFVESCDAQKRKRTLFWIVFDRLHSLTGGGVRIFLWSNGQFGQPASAASGV